MSSMWWARRDELDEHQIRLIEELDLEGSYLVLGPPGSGKTNVLLRRAQFIRTQSLPNVRVLTFTRSLTEFLRTGCYNSNGHSIFPTQLITTIESWEREVFRRNKVDIPSEEDFDTYKAKLAQGALDLELDSNTPKLDAIFVDEAQDLLPEELELIAHRAERLYFVGDDRQKIFKSDGLAAIRSRGNPPEEHVLPFHYRLAPEICAVADRILTNVAGGPLEATSHYAGPKPGRITAHPPESKGDQLKQVAAILEQQLRAYGDLLGQGDKIGVVVPGRTDRDLVHAHLETERGLIGKSQIIRSRNGEKEDRSYSPELDPQRPILIMTEQSCKGLEFRALHWLFANELAHYRTRERYYTVVTRAKTSLDIYYEEALPETLAAAYSEPEGDIWE